MNGSTRTRKLTLKLLKDIISQKRLKGGLDSKTAAIKTCVNLLASLRMNAGREWIRGNRPCDDFVSEQRKIAANEKLGPGIRADACRRLIVLGGWASADILSKDAADEYTRTFVTESPQPQQVKLDTESDIERALAKWKQQQEEAL